MADDGTGHHVRRFQEVQRTALHGRWDTFLECFAATGDVGAAADAAGVKRGTVNEWGRRFPEFRTEYRRLKRAYAQRGVDDRAWGFAEFREEFLGMTSPWHHLLAIDAYENTPPGNVTLILWPPEHGKTTLGEDYSTFKLSTDKSFRITAGSETQTMSRKILRRVRNRLSADGPCRALVARFGPFEPQQGHSTQPWGADHFDVAGKADHDERDYSMVALGMTSQIAGTRTDHLHVDDPQSMKTINRTEQFVDMFRQDWLSRPGEEGRTCINGTRVGTDDFFSRLMLELPKDILRIIKLPALTIETDPDTGVEVRKPLWPEKFTVAQLDRMRAKVGDDAWFRNYMQQPRQSGSATFKREILHAARNHARPKGPATPDSSIIVGVDPAIGGRNAIVACQAGVDKLTVLDWRADSGLTTYDEIFDAANTICERATRTGGVITDFVIETMAFQKGMSSDRRLEELQRRYGFSVRPHQVGVNKYDETFGVPQMATTFERREIDLPYGGDEDERRSTNAFIEELENWRPYQRGSRLRQDLLMAMFFCWIVWKERRGFVDPKTSSFTTAGSPFTAGGSSSWVLSNAGLALPNSRRRSA